MPTDRCTVDRELNLATALALADRLVDGAIWAGDACTFAGATSPAAMGEPAPYVTVGGDAYEGTAGIARLLFRVGDLASDDRYVRTARAALRHAIEVASGPSLFSGTLGVGLIALESGRAEFTADGTRLIAEAVDSARALRLGAPTDLLAGLAGVVVGLDTALDAASAPRSEWLAAMVEFGSTLVELGEPDVMGRSWPMFPGAGTHLCGLAHGAAGIAYAMGCLDRRVPHAGPWLETAQQARDFERMHYSTHHGSWADLRPDDPVDHDQPTMPTEPTYPHMWCHGSHGIAAERLVAEPGDVFAGIDRIAALASVRHSTEATIELARSGRGSHMTNGSQCHGLSGAIDVLIDAALVADDPTSDLELAHQAADAMRTEAERDGRWRCGIPDAAEAPGLMLGLAGIGWAMLRLADPHLVPSAWRLGGGLRTSVQPVRALTQVVGRRC